MQSPTILVTGATGKTGGAVVRALLGRGVKIRALVHRQDGRSAALERLGVQTVVADIFDADQLEGAMRGTQRAYFVPVFHPQMIHSAAAFAAAARAAKLEQVVQLSQWLAQPAHPSLATRQIWLADQIFAMIPGIAHTILNPGMFADNFLRLIDFASLLRIYPVLTGKSLSAPVANEDIARVAAEVLLDPAPHAGKTYRPTGPKLLSAYDMGGIIAQALGHSVLPVPLPMWMFQRAARIQGVDSFDLSGYRHYMEDHRRGAFALGGGVTDVVQSLTGSPAEDFATTARRYAAMPFARKTLGNRLRAFANFNLVPFYPGYDLDARDRAERHPVPPQPRLSIDDARWRHQRLAASLGDGAGTHAAADERLAA